MEEWMEELPFSSKMNLLLLQLSGVGESKKKMRRMRRMKRMKSCRKSCRKRHEHEDENDENENDEVKMMNLR